ncbi:VOC family protein [Pontiellaceae bacterium B12227]|nr:VOC family protein [Pontiellaceae bacterium B12227]
MIEWSKTEPLLLVSDIRKSVAFYQEKLGFELQNTWEPNGRLTWCRIAFEGAALMLQQDCPEDLLPHARGTGVTFYIICSDAPAVYRTISGHGVQATEPSTEFYGMIQTHLADPDGYRICFESPVK